MKYLLVLSVFLFLGSYLPVAYAVRGGAIKPTPSSLVEFFGTYGALAPRYASSAPATHAARGGTFLSGILRNMFDTSNVSSGSAALSSSSAATASRPLSIQNSDFAKELAELFALGKLFAGHSGGLLSPNGTDLGDIFILSRIFR